MSDYTDPAFVRQRIKAAKRRLQYWKTVSPSNTRKSRGEGIDNARADLAQLNATLRHLLTRFS